MNDADFLSMMRQIGLDAKDHDVDELRAAHQRLSGLFAHLETQADRAKAQALSVFDPKAPL